jgi:DNA polymerase-3 subunit delta'
MNAAAEDNAGQADWPHPRANTRLVGHEAAERVLLDGWNSGRMAHAWLITGPKGVGKATLAYRFAKFVLSQGETAGGGDLFGDGPADLAAPSGSAAVARVAAGSHGDLLAIERQWDDKRKRLRSEIVVGDVQRLGPFFGKTAGEGGWRIAIIDSADEMNRNAANAVLKNLEEPPARALFLLVSHAPGRLLPTIRSRCRTLALRPLPDARVAGLVGDFLPDMLEQDRMALARLGEGSPGRALNLAASGGLEIYRSLVELMSAPRLDVGAVHALGDQLSRKDADVHYHTLMDLVSWWLARLIRSRATGEIPEDVVPGEARVLQNLGAGRPLEQLVELWEKVNRLVERADSVNLSRKQVVLSVFSSFEQLH